MIISNYFRTFAPENKKITIMTQILVTLNEDATTLHVRKAIELLALCESGKAERKRASATCICPFQG